MARSLYWQTLPALFVMWLAFGLRLFRLDLQSIWWDEGHSIFVATHALAEIPTLPAMDVHPPAYFALLHLWLNLAGLSEFALRFLSVTFSLLTVALCWRFAYALAAPVGPVVMDTKPIPHGHKISQLPSTHQRRHQPIAQGHEVFQVYLRPQRLASLLAGLLAALAPLYVAYAQEVRSYAMVTFLALASTFALWQMTVGIRASTKSSGNSTELLDTGQVSRFRLPPAYRRLLTYIIFTAACLYTHYFTIFLLLFQNLVWLVWIAANQFAGRFGRHIDQDFQPGRVISGEKNALQSEAGQSRFAGAQLRASADYAEETDLTRSRQVWLWATSQAGIFILFLPQLRLALQQITTYTNPNLLPPGLVHFINRSWQAYTVGLTIDPGPARWGMAGLCGVFGVSWLVITGYWLGARTQVAGVRHQSRLARSLLGSYVFLLAWFLVPLIAYFVVLQRQPSFEPRYVMLVTPSLFLLLALSLTHVFTLVHQAQRPVASAVRSKSYVLRLLSYLILAIPFVVFGIGLYSYFTNRTYFKDDSASVASWLASETTPRDIVYIDVPHPFHYYAGSHQIPAPTRYLFVDIHTAADRLNREAAGRDRLYWVTWHGSDTDPRGVLPFLVTKVGQPLGQRDFRGYHVEWFGLPPDVHFSLPATLEPATAVFGDVLRLDGIAYSDSVTACRPPWATLHFSLLRPTDVDYRVSLRLRDQAGNIVSQRDRDLLNDRHFRTSAWPLDDVALNQATNVYTLPWSPEIAPGVYRLEVVVYDAQPPYPSEGVTESESKDGVSAVLASIVVTP